MRPPDIPAPVAGLLIAALIIALTYLMTVGWNRPDPKDRP